jgi:hypothetical protein
MTPEVEMRHIASGPLPGDRPVGVILLRLEAVTSNQSREVLSRAREVLTAVLANGAKAMDLEAWRQALPRWFVERSAPEQTRAEAEEWLAWWRTLPPAEQGAADARRDWSLDDWLYWFEPEQRSWYWWDARPLDESTVEVVIDALEAPPPVGALEWLLRAAGAERLVAGRRNA